MERKLHDKDSNTPVVPYPLLEVSPPTKPIESVIREVLELNGVYRFTIHGCISSAPPPSSAASPPSSKVFVCNLPLDFSQDQLFALFAKHGSINRAFLPDKLTSSGKRFGFVFFPSAEAAAPAVAKLHRMLVGSERLIVDFSTGPVRNTGKRSEPPLRPSRSFRDVVKGVAPHPQPSRVAPLNCSGASNPLWPDLLSHSIIGVASPSRSFESLKESLESGLELRLLGAGAFLISFPCLASFNDSQSEVWSDLRFNFLSLFPAVNNVVGGGRFCWISIIGIPLDGWSEASIKSLALSVGTPIFIHPSSVSQDRLDSAFVLIFSKLLDPLKVPVDLKIGNNCYPTRITEVNPSLLPHLPFDASTEREALKEGEFKLRFDPEVSRCSSDASPVLSGSGVLGFFSTEPQKSPCSSENSPSSLAPVVFPEPACRKPLSVPPTVTSVFSLPFNAVRHSSSPKSHAPEVPKTSVFEESHASDLLTSIVNEVDLGLGHSEDQVRAFVTGLGPSSSGLSGQAPFSSFIAGIHSPSQAEVEPPKAIRQKKRKKVGRSKLGVPLKDISLNRSLRKKSDAKRGWSMCKSLGFTSRAPDDVVMKIFVPP